MSLVSVALACVAGLATACFKPAIERADSAGDTLEETQDSLGGDAAQDDVCQGDECSPVGCPEEPASGPGRWARVFAEGPLVPLAAARLASGDLVVAGLVEAGEVTFPDLGGASLAFEAGDPDALVAVVRIGRDSGRALWLGQVRGRLGGGETPRVTLYGAHDGNAFVLGLMLSGPVEVSGTGDTTLSVDETVGSATLIRFEGDGRIRHAGVIKAGEGEVFLGTQLSAQNVWLTLSARGPAIPLVEGMSDYDPEVRSAAARLSTRGADMPFATRTLGVAGLQHLSAMSNRADDTTTTVGFTFGAVTVPGVDGAEVVDANGQLLRFAFAPDGALRSWRALQLFEPGEIRPGPLFQHYFPWSLIDADRGMFVLSEFGGAKAFGEGEVEEIVVHARRGMAVAVYDGSGRLFEVDSIIHDTDESARTLAAGGQLTEEGLVLWGWSSGRLAIGDRGLQIGSSRRAVSASWGWDGRLKWARAHGEGSGSAMFTAGALSEGELIVLGVVDGRLDMSGSTLSTLGPSAFVANLGPPNGLECGTDSVGR